MKINEVEAAVGVTKKNIRFYEEEGLITPGREPGNGYRSYSQTDVERLRRIKLLRKLDVPLAEIREMLEGQSTLAEGMNRQLERLSTRRKDLEEAYQYHRYILAHQLRSGSGRLGGVGAVVRINQLHGIGGAADIHSGGLLIGILHAQHLLLAAGAIVASGRLKNSNPHHIFPGFTSSTVAGGQP